jgi:hypothetical protein
MFCSLFHNTNAFEYLFLYEDDQKCLPCDGMGYSRSTEVENTVVGNHSCSALLLELDSMPMDDCATLKNECILCPDTSVTPCNVGSQISCAVTRPAGVFTCDTLTAPVADTCPTGAELLIAYLIYDGSAGPSAFLEITCDNSEYIAQQVQAGQVVEFNTRGSSACVEATVAVYESDPLLGGSEVGSSALQIACPGPWTLGATIAPGFVLDSYVSTSNNGITLDRNTLSVEIEIIYIGHNTGSVPLTITSGEIVSPLGTGSIIGLPTTVAKKRQILNIQVGNIQLSGQRGQILTIRQILNGVSNNEFCEDSSELVINL